MAGIKISSLPALPSSAIGDLAAFVQGGVTYKGSNSQLITLFNAQLSFLPLAGGTLTGALILNTSTPTTDLQAASKGYVDTVAQGITVQGACRLGTTVALTVTYSNGTAGVGATLTNAGAQAALSLDGVATVVNDRILVKNQASTLQNGIYTVTNIGSGATNWVLTRSTDYDQPAEINPGDLVVITAGSTQTSSSWLEGATVTAIGTDPITFTQFSASLPITLSNGGTSASLVANNGGIFYSTASAGAILAGTATATQMLQSGSSTTPAWSTTTWPATSTINQLLYSSSANVIAGLATANSAGLTTSAGGVPIWVAYTGTGAPVLGTSPTITTPNTVGTATNNNAAAGSVGEFISSVIASGGAVTQLSNAASDLTSISLTAGDWDVWGNVVFQTVGVAAAQALGWSSLASATVPDSSLWSQINLATGTLAATTAINILQKRYSLAGTTTIFISGFLGNSSGNGTICGGIYARRVR